MFFSGMISELNTSLRRLYEKLGYILLCMVLDLLFFFVYGIVSFFAMSVVYKLINDLSGYLSASPELVVSLASDPLYKQQLNELLVVVLIAIAFTYVIYTILHGINWFIVSRKLLNYKIKFWTYIGKFAVTSLLCFSSIAILVVAYLKISFTSLFESQQIAWIIFLVLLFIVLWFGFITHALAPSNKLKDIYKKTFRIGIKKAHYVLLIYAVLVIIGIIINFILSLFGKLSPGLLYAGGILLFLPFMTFFRTHLTQTINKLDKNNKKKNKTKKRR